MDVLQSGIFSFTYGVLAPGELRSHGEILSMGCEIHGKVRSVARHIWDNLDMLQVGD